MSQAKDRPGTLDGNYSSHPRPQAGSGRLRLKISLARGSRIPPIRIVANNIDSVGEVERAFNYAGPCHEIDII